MKAFYAAPLTLLIMMTAPAFAACEGGLGRGWSKGQGKGEFSMSAADGQCVTGYANFYADGSSTGTPATEVALTTAPKNGKISIGKQGVIYTPAAGFKGKDKFCTRNTAPGVKGSLSGCITVTVR